MVVNKMRKFVKKNNRYIVIAMSFLFALMLHHSVNLRAEESGKEKATTDAIAIEGPFNITIANPQPGTLPTIGVWRRPQSSNSLSIRLEFPNVPGMVVDAWCYEHSSQGLSTEPIGIRSLEDGKVEIRHRVVDFPDLVHVTTITPEAGAVDFTGRIEQAKNQDACEIPADLKVPDMCSQLMRSPAFQSNPPDIPRCSPEPEYAAQYYEFVKRCFIFTGAERTFLDKTHRTEIASIHRFEPDDPRDNPPAVQMYYGPWQQPLEGISALSLTQYSIPLLGVVSLDGKYLAAVASDHPQFISQAWLDCLHNYAQWAPADAPPLKRTWRRKIYGMENRPRDLRERVLKDFPQLEQ